MFVFGHPDRPASGLRRGIELLTGVALLLLAAGLAWGFPGRENPTGTTTTGSCLYLDTTAEERAAALDLCDRRVRDEAVRGVLSTEQVQRHQETSGQLYQMLRRALCDSPTSGGCYSSRARPAVSADVREVRQALAQADHPGAVVRLAHPDDPVRADAVIFAVRIADVCILGSVDGGRGPGITEVVGLLPNGQCLAT